jgi:hypothetical protein
MDKKHQLENQDLYGKSVVRACHSGLRKLANPTAISILGIQLFFRGANAIQTLRKIVTSGVLASGASRATLLYNRLRQLRDARGLAGQGNGLCGVSPGPAPARPNAGCTS